VTLLVQFRIALQVRRKSRRAVQKITEKMCINVYNNMIGHSRSSFDRIGSVLLIYFDLFVDGQIIYLMILLVNTKILYNCKHD